MQDNKDSMENYKVRAWMSLGQRDVIWEGGGLLLLDSVVVGQYMDRTTIFRKGISFS